MLLLITEQQVIINISYVPKGSAKMTAALRSSEIHENNFEIAIKKQWLVRTRI